MEAEKYQKYERAVKRVKAIRDFYKHLVTYLVFVIALMILKTRIIYFVSVNSEQPDPEVLDWVRVNIYVLPIIWGTALLIQGIYVYRRKFNFFKDWEERKIKELMGEEEEQESTRWE